MSNYVQGKFRPSRPEKYRGDLSQIYYRSSWELSYMMRLDRDDNIVEWSSEEVKIPYRSVDGKVHTYHPDFKIKQRDGKTFIVEIKPMDQVEQPKKPKRMTAGFKRRIETWMRNQLKWKYAREWASDRGMTFMLITENELGIH